MMIINMIWWWSWYDDDDYDDDDDDYDVDDYNDDVGEIHNNIIITQVKWQKMRETPIVKISPISNPEHSPAI